MKVYLDDIREAPDGWIRTRTVKETLRLLATQPQEVTHLSLDHDLGNTEESGYDVICWIERNVMIGFIPPEITVHSANPVGRARMEVGINKIKYYRECYAKFLYPPL